ncbi:MAG: zinc-dependent alcohol dehydrogenase family protein, partial [Acidobacteria bacterium]|nr:zinc-dependent alcohol dehydrogenase family protein [Acidobacteriota bacterium]
MRAMVLRQTGKALLEEEWPDPVPGAGQVLLDVRACAVCRTDLHVVNGELANPSLPLIPGHEIVGRVLALGPGARRWTPGDRVGVGWLGWTCEACQDCLSGRENLCDQARFTGYQIPGGYATRAVADERFAFPLPVGYSDLEAAPLLCAGFIGYRSLKAAGDAQSLGLYGFGAAAHLVLQVARHQGRRVFAFTRPGDQSAQHLARSLGAAWAGGSDEPAPDLMDAAILFAPVGALVPLALGGVRKGGVVVCAGIHMSDIPSFPYELLWGERTLKSVANLTRQDGEEFLKLASELPIRTQVRSFDLQEANEALRALKQGEIHGAAVL